MRLLVTGGCGFIGGNVVNYMMRQHPDWRVRVLDKMSYAGSLARIDATFRDSARFELVEGDILDRSLVERAVDGVDVVLHFAAESHVSYSFSHADLFANVNVVGTSVLCETIVKHPVEKLVLISSSEVYGTCLREPMDEDHPLNPRSPYAGTKAAADRLAYSHHVTYDLPLVIVRPFNNYGPYQHTEKVVPRFISAALRGEDIHVHDDGLQTRDWLYVEDHAEAIDRIVQADAALLKGEVLNIGTGREASIRSVAERVLAAVGGPSRLVLNSQQRPGQVRRQRSSTEKARRLLGWEARTPFEEGLERTIAWYRANEDWWRSLREPDVARPAAALA